MIAFAVILAVLSVVESDGSLRVERDGSPVIQGVIVDRGEGGDGDVKRSFTVTTEGSKVWNYWSEERDRRFRLEVAARADGAVELTMAGEVDHLGTCRRRVLSFEVPHEVLDGYAYRRLGRPLNRMIEDAGVFGAETMVFQARFLAVNGLAFDFNPTGPGDYYASESDGWSHMDTWFGFSTISRGRESYRFSTGGEVASVWGGYTGAKIVIREGGFEEYEHQHALRSFHYADELRAADYVRYGDRSKGRLYTADHGRGRSSRIFRCAADGFHLVTFAAGNYAGVPNCFTVAANGEMLLNEVTVTQKTARVVTKMVHTLNQEIEVVWSGDWLVSFVAVQPLLADGEDFAIARKPWAVDGYEPGTLNRNDDFKRPANLTKADDVYELPEPGRECAAALRKPPLRDYRVDPPAKWIHDARIVRVFNNTSSLDGLSADGELERYFEREIDGAGYTTIMLSGMLSRHTYVGHMERGLRGVGRFTAEAHRRGYKVIDHLDATLLWNLGGGFRVLGERLNETIRSRGTYLPSCQFCLSNPDFRRQLFEYVRRDVEENQVDGLQIDEVQPWVMGCVCRHCRSAFERDTGWMMPMDETSPLWAEGSEFNRVWKTWRYRQSTDFLGELRASLKPIKPDLVLSAYVTPYGLSSSYEPLGLGREIFDLPRAVDFFGVEVMTRDVLNAPMDILVTHRLMSQFQFVHGLPVWNWYYNADWRNDYAAWALDEMTAQCPLLADVAHPADTPDYVHFSAGMRRRGAISMADVAVVFPFAERIWSQDWHGRSDCRIVDSLRSGLLILEKRHIPYDVVTEEYLRDHGDRYRFVVRSASDIDAALASAVWKVEAPETVAASLWREADGSLAVHLLNLTGGARAPFEPPGREVVLELPYGSSATVTSPEFQGVRGLLTSSKPDGRLTVRVPKEMLGAYVFIRIAR